MASPNTNSSSFWRDPAFWTAIVSIVFIVLAFFFPELRETLEKLTAPVTALILAIFARSAAVRYAAAAFQGKLDGPGSDGIPGFNTGTHWWEVWRDPAFLTALISIAFILGAWIFPDLRDLLEQLSAPITALILAIFARSAAVQYAAVLRGYKFGYIWNSTVSKWNSTSGS
jgi:hypothetical protein